MIKKIISSYATLSYRKKILDGEFENRTAIIGSAVFPTFALFNHSCDSNTYKYFVGNKLVVVASKVGKKKKKSNFSLINPRIFNLDKKLQRITFPIAKCSRDLEGGPGSEITTSKNRSCFKSNDDWFG